VPLLFDADPETGVTTYFDYDPIKDQVLLTSHQDVTGFLDRMKAIRDDEDYSRKGIKEDWWHYASIPTIVEMELMKRGLYLHKKDDMPAILKIINSEYPYLKLTTKRHE
jgi:hypothetical protein